MIDVDLLKSVKTIVTHEGCADGIASALILKDALPDAEVVFVQYNTPAWRGLRDRQDTGQVLFCDMTPPPEDADAFVEDGAIVLDHHRGARKLVVKFGDRGVFADEETEPGVSGALLAFREVWTPIGNWRSPSFGMLGNMAELAGIRDTWQRSSPRWEEACAQAAALRFWPWDTWTMDRLEGRMLYEVFPPRMEIGPVLLRKEAEKVERSICEAYYFKVGDLGCAAFEGLHTSDVAERLEKERDVDLVLGWHYACEGGRKLVVSCRSRGWLSALTLAKRYGGGGHDRAAGFTIDLSKFDPRLGDGSPYSMIRSAVEEAL